jgi:C-terminal processing protease CtpA/Prc
MVGRLRENRLIVRAVGSSSAWRALLERRNVPAAFDLSLQGDPYLPTDLTSFYTKQVPGLDFFTNLHEDYNRPTDDAGTLNYEGMTRIARFAAQLIRDAADPKQEIEHVRVQQTSAPGSGMGRRTYTGMVPDFAGGAEDGMLVSDVRPGGPAEKAGVRGGDVVVEFAGKSIGSLQDYSDALRAAKVGDPVTIVVLRDGKRVNLTITPEARKQ